ncbi:dihydroneopterin aldolase [Thiomicrorhabdus sp.]|uniref:dihydroneopterin aldolase n=1 Tax=Thiomicrorhabdus sp. TaxID=2039724 RepID=UPI0029C6B8DF|nr:dihydroneopterin aldolase [Thiomicrorhabdus sp.]
MPTDLDIIYIENLKTEAIIGIYDWEREQTQPLNFDVEMGVKIKNAADSDHIDDTVSYKEVADQIGELVTNSRVELLETLCENICAFLFEQHPLIETIQLKVGKPLAVEEADTVGLKLFRRRT